MQIEVESIEMNCEDDDDDDDDNFNCGFNHLYLAAPLLLFNLLSNFTLYFSKSLHQDWRPRL